MIFWGANKTQSLHRPWSWASLSGLCAPALGSCPSTSTLNTLYPPTLPTNTPPCDFLILPQTVSYHHCFLFFWWNVSERQGEGQVGKYLPDSGFLVSDVKQLWVPTGKNLRMFSCGRLKRPYRQGFPLGGQMNLTVNLSRSPEENKVYHQKCISQLGLYQKGELREKVIYRLICCFPAGNGFNIRDIMLRLHLAFAQWRTVTQCQARSVCCAGHRVRLWTSRVPALRVLVLICSLLLKFLLPWCLGPWNYLLSLFQGADPTLPEISSLHILIKALPWLFKVCSKSTSSAKPAPGRECAPHSRKV